MVWSSKVSPAEHRASPREFFRWQLYFPASFAFDSLMERLQMFSCCWIFTFSEGLISKSFSNHLKIEIKCFKFTLLCSFLISVLYCWNWGILIKKNWWWQMFTKDVFWKFGFYCTWQHYLTTGIGFPAIIHWKVVGKPSVIVWS